MITAQGSLTMIGLHTTEPQVFWNGNLVAGVTGIAVDNDDARQRVVLVIKEDPLIAEMQAAGIVIRRVV